MIWSQGDIVEVDFGPSRGHEPAKRRPAIVVSGFRFNSMTSMTLVCPISTRTVPFPLHEPLPDGCAVRGCVIMEQVSALDLSVRNPVLLDRIDGAPLHDILETIGGFVEDEARL